MMYLGPYVEILIPTAQRKQDKCREPTECPDPQSGFCTKCGLDISDRWYKVTEDVPVSLGEILAERQKEVLTTAFGMGGTTMKNGVRLYHLIPNKRRGAARDLWLDNRDAFDIDIEQIDIVQEKEWFKDKFGSEMGEIERTYVAEPNYGGWILKWGLLQWF